MTWAETAISEADEKALKEGAPPISPLAKEQAQKASKYLDITLQGVSDAVKSDVLRVMLTLGLRADDETNVLLALYGYFKAVGEQIPDEIRGASREFYDYLDKFSESIEGFNDTSRHILADVIRDIKVEAAALARAQVNSVAISTIDELRFNLLSVTKEMLTDFRTSVVAEHGTAVNAALIMRMRIVTAACAVALILLGMFFGRATVKPALSQAQQHYISDGMKVDKMYTDPATPKYVKDWIARWSKTH